MSNLQDAQARRDEVEKQVLVWVRTFIVVGVLGILFGILDASQFGVEVADSSGIAIMDGIFNISQGIVALLIAFLLHKRMQVLFLVVILDAIAVQAYAIGMGRGINYIFLLVCFAFAYILYALWKHGIFSKSS